MTAGLRIGELAKRTNCHIETIRYYEREGLLHAPERTDGNYRLYHDEQVERLRFIRQCRSLDMGVDEIRILLKFRDAPGKNCGEVNTVLDEHIGHVARRIAELKTMEGQLKELRQRCIKARAARDCGILNELGQAGNSRILKEPRSGRMSGAHALGRRSR
ncbi:MAG: Cd(II)/Pb(II)-responsive transcriptional regulator [Burkholderiales bacterium]